MNDTTKSTEVAVNPTVAFSKFLDSFKPQLKLAMPSHLNPDRMARLALTAFSKNPKLQKCDAKSLAGAILTSAQLGLEIEVNGQAFLVPYLSKGQLYAQLVPGWKGLVDLVARSGRGTVYTGVIFKDQEYTFVDGSRRELTIHNETELDDPADITHAYAIGWVVGAAMPIIELWRMGRILKHRDAYNKVGSLHYSFGNIEMYARKVPLLQVLKYMPTSVELSNAIAVANATETGRGAVLEQDGAGGSYVTLLDDDDAPIAPETPMPTRRSAPPPAAAAAAATPAAPAPKPGPSAAAAEPTGAAKVQANANTNGEPTGEVASPGLANFIRVKMDALGLSQQEAIAMLAKHGAQSIGQLTPDAAMQIKAQLVEMAEAQ